MSNLQAQHTTNTTTFNDGSQIKTTEFTKKTNLATDQSDTGKPEFDYNRPVPTTMQSTAHPIATTTTNTTSAYSTTNPNTTGQGSTSEHLKQKVHDITHSIEEAVTSASHSINHAISSHKSQPAATATTTQQYNTAAPGSEYNTSVNQPQQQHPQQGGFGTKLNDMMAHVSAALSHGHPVHAVTNASTAAKVGECERAKHEKGPLVDDNLGTTNSNSLNNPNFNAAGQPYENTSSAAQFNQPTSNTFNQSTAYGNPSTTYGNQSTLNQSSGNSNYTTSDKFHDMASHASAQLSHGNPIHAVTDAPAAARIAEAEKLKHAKGPLNEPAVMNDSTLSGQSIPSGTGHGSFGGVSGMSGQSGAASTMSTQELNQKRTY